VARYTPLAKDKAVSQEELDDAVQARLAAQAQVQSAQAAVDQAQLSLSFTHVVSPIDGIAGLIQAQIGDLVGPTTGA
jgi:membrane fusion protein (multidrug efflux system)